MEMTELLKGRSDENRLPKELKCYDILDTLEIEYYRVDHDYADTIEQCHDIETVLGCEICKNLFLTNRQQTDFYLLLMPGDKPFKTKILSKEINTSRLSFGSPDHMLEYLDITPGSVSVLGLANDSQNKIQLLIDNDLLKNEYIGCHPCINSSTLKIRTEDIVKKFLQKINHTPIYVNLPWTFEEEN